MTAGAAAAGVDGAVVSVCTPGEVAPCRAAVAPPVRQIPRTRLISLAASAADVDFNAAASGSVNTEPTIISLMPPGPKAPGFAR